MNANAGRVKRFEAAGGVTLRYIRGSLAFEYEMR
jgi:hypothetical protein